MIDEAKRQAESGSLVQLNFHACPPTISGQSCNNWDDQGVHAKLSDSQWRDLVRNNGNLNRKWKQRLDEIVPFLQQLQDAGISVLWRPLHEINGGWFWWGGRPGPSGSRMLFQLTWDYLVRTKGLSNLIWVWNVSDFEMGVVDDYWPGASYVDVVSLDVYKTHQPIQEDYEKILGIGRSNGNTPIALGEVGSIPSPDTLDQQPNWVWFMCWSEHLTNQTWNTEESIKATYYLPRTLNQGEIGVGTSN